MIAVMKLMEDGVIINNFMNLELTSKEILTSLDSKNDDSNYFF
jgi:hypothetical protein